MIPQPRSAENARATSFTTPAAEVFTTLEIQRSVFLTLLVPVSTEEAAREVIEEQRRAHHDARHHCSAFVLGPDRDIQRSSDDGEPGGTAGVPMMQALLQRETRDGVRDLTDVVAVVTRWFGGILLGAGGLVRAYSNAVSGAIDAAETTRFARRRELWVDAPMSLAGRAEHALRLLGYPLLDVGYDAAGVSLALAVPDSQDELVAAEAQVARSLAGEATTRRGAAVWSA